MPSDLIHPFCFSLQEVIDLNDSRADPFILPFIQGFIELQVAPLDFEEPAEGMLKLSQPNDSNLPDYYTIALISRRSRHRAGGSEIITWEWIE